MTNEEAMRKIESQKLWYLEEYVDYSSISEAYDMAIQALEKQIPKKPERDGGIRFCVECGEIVKSYMDYCDGCGQRLDWSDK